MKSKGLGDTVEKFMKTTGIHSLAKATGKVCGCNKRQDTLNRLFPYNN